MKGLLVHCGLLKKNGNSNTDFTELSCFLNDARAKRAKSTYTYSVASIGDNAMTSSIRIAQVFPELVGKKAHYDAYFHINDDAKECRYFSFKKNLYCLIIHLSCFHKEYYKKYALPWIH